MFLPGSVPVSLVIWNEDVGGDPADWTDYGDLPPQGGKKVGTAENLYIDIQELVLTPARLCPASCGIGDNGDLHLQTPEYSHATHGGAAYYRTLSGGGAEARLAGLQ